MGKRGFRHLLPLYLLNSFFLHCTHGVKAVVFPRLAWRRRRHRGDNGDIAVGGGTSRRPCETGGGRAKAWREAARSVWMM